MPEDTEKNDSNADELDELSATYGGRPPHTKRGKAPILRFNSTGGGSLTDVYERDFKQMELDGEL